MKKNGAYFLSIVDRGALRPGIWDPYCYRERKQSQTLGSFVSIHLLKATTLPRHTFKFASLEYRHIARGHVPAFTLEPRPGAYRRVVLALAREFCFLARCGRTSGMLLSRHLQTGLANEAPSFSP